MVNGRNHTRKNKNTELTRKNCKSGRPRATSKPQPTINQESKNILAKTRRKESKKTYHHY